MPLSFSGQIGEAIFAESNGASLPRTDVQSIFANVERDLSHFPKLDDDRVAALVGALVVETSLDDLLRAMLPGYGRLIQNKDFTFSLKIELARALRLCPARIFGAADTVRRIRNEFAHKLEVTSLDELDVKLVRSMRGVIRQFDSEFERDQPSRIAFIALSTYVAAALRIYAVHVGKLSQFVRSGAGVAAFQRFGNGVAKKANRVSRSDKSRKKAPRNTKLEAARRIARKRAN